MCLWPYLHVWWMSIKYFELFCSDPGQLCTSLTELRKCRTRHSWQQHMNTADFHRLKSQELAGFSHRISTSLFSHTCTHRWNRLVFTQCYNSTGQDWRHNSDRSWVSRGQILEASCVCSQFYGEYRILWFTHCVNQSIRDRVYCFSCVVHWRTFINNACCALWLIQEHLITCVYILNSICNRDWLRARRYLHVHKLLSINNNYELLIKYYLWMLSSCH